MNDLKNQRTGNAENIDRTCAGRRLRRFGWVILTVLGVLLIAGEIGGQVTKHAINRRLASLTHYRGHLDTVRIAWWRGKVTAGGFTLVRLTPQGDQSVLRIASGELAPELWPLLHRTVIGPLAVREMEWVIAEGSVRKEKPGTKESGADARPPFWTWRKICQENFAVQLTQVEIAGLTLSFLPKGQGPGSTRAKSPVLEAGFVSAHGLRVQPTADDPFPATVSFSAGVKGGGRVRAMVRGASTVGVPRFEAKVQGNATTLAALHALLRAYAGLDVKGGSLDLYLAVKAEDGHYDGYVKPFFRDFDFKAVAGPRQHPAQQAVTAVASALHSLLTSEAGKLATKVPFKGDFTANEVDLWSAVEALLFNAFVSSIPEEFEEPKQGT